ncbi:MAG: serine--tRNA ligase [Candidatus Moranbacteria bacterium]|nr:serine--tRNA ligase [Candidatus Moranbacteria bacterium]NTW75506.1 serine--tRNA ligase [Candidatus Moranbacteria bacterium]
MLDIQFIRDHKDEVAAAAKGKKLTFDIEALFEADRARIEAAQALESAQAEKNGLNQKIAQAKSDEERQAAIAEGKAIKEKIESLEPMARETKARFDALMVLVPNIVAEDTPEGQSDEDNVEVARNGEIREFGFEPKDHIALGESLGLFDLERGTKVAGYRGYYLKGDGALLALGLMSYALSKMSSKGYLPMIPPTLVKGFPLFGSGYFKGLEYDGEVDEIYQVASSDKETDGSESKEKKFLVGTSEPSLLAFHSGETLEAADLPIRYAGFSQCYRSEIGSYGKDTKGLYRVHEFMKVEQVVLAPADIDMAETLQAEMLSITEEILSELGLPYRKIRICAGDMGTGKYKAFDLEAWMPGLDRWGELGSASNFTDWQARRLDVKYRDPETGKKIPVYMLNNTALTSIRPLIAILENFQQADGSVVVPEVLRPYVGKDRLIAV